jgi:hypothetical protein
MQRLREVLELLDECISDLEDKVGLDVEIRRDAQRKQNELLKMSRTREANVLAVAQKVASRLDQTIQHVENIVRH